MLHQLTWLLDSQQQELVLEIWIAIYRLILKHNPWKHQPNGFWIRSHCWKTRHWKSSQITEQRVWWRLNNILWCLGHSIVSSSRYLWSDTQVQFSGSFTAQRWSAWPLQSWSALFWLAISASHGELGIKNPKKHRIKMAWILQKQIPSQTLPRNQTPNMIIHSETGT